MLLPLLLWAGAPAAVWAGALGISGALGEVLLCLAGEEDAPRKITPKRALSPRETHTGDLTSPLVCWQQNPEGGYFVAAYESETYEVSDKVRRLGTIRLACAQGKHIVRLKGFDAENLAKVRKALEKGLSMDETVELPGISLSSAKRCCKHLQGALT